MMTEYRVLDSTDPADVREGDRVTYTRPKSDWPEDEHRGIARYFDGNLYAAGRVVQGNLYAAGRVVQLGNGNNSGSKIILIERPTVKVPTHFGATVRDGDVWAAARIRGNAPLPWVSNPWGVYSDAEIQEKLDNGFCVVWTGEEA